MDDARFPVVAVPARNEAERLPGLLAALAGQEWCRSGTPLDVVIVFNNCGDGSASVARRAAAGLPGLRLHPIEIDFPPEVAHVGSARRLAMDRAARLVADRRDAAILTTDADAVPSRRWVSANLAALREGADLVGGRLVGDPAEEAALGPRFVHRAALEAHHKALCDRLAALVDPLAHDPEPRHWDHTGASLAVRVATYRAVGGVRPLPLREDLDLVSRARAAGYRLRHAPDVEVTVSARLDGRAKGGMATCLQGWLAAEAEGRPLLVEDPGTTLARLLRRRDLREVGALPPAERAARLAALGAGPVEARDAAGWAPAALAERFAPDEPDAPATVPAERAIAALQTMLCDMETSVAA